MTSSFARLRSLLRNLVRARSVERDLDAELRGYVDMLADENVAKGVDPERARRDARLALGGLDQVKEEVRSVRAGALLEQLAQDVRYAIRGLRRAPVFSLAAIVTLALGLGANTAMFSVIDALLLRPLPVHEPGRLVAVYGGPSGSAGAFSLPGYREIRGQRRVFSGVAAWGGSSAWLRASGELERVVLQIVSPEYFSVLGVAPELGAGFAQVDETASRNTVVISDRLWRTRFGADPAVAGRQITLNGHALSVVGVAPPAFTGLQPSAPADAWVTFASLPGLEPGWNFDARDEIWLHLIARLNDDVDRRAAEAALTAVSSRLGTGGPAPSGTPLRLVPASTPIFDPEARDSSSKLALLVWSVAALVLLIACANVANLLVVRGRARRREIGLRLAVGASRARIARQMITEAVVLGVIGCAVGLAVAYWTIQAVIALAPPSAIPPAITVALDGRVLAFAALLTMVTTLAFGAWPAWQVTRLDLAPVMKDGPEQDGASSAALGLRRALVVTQVALSVVLLVGAALFVRTLTAALAIAPGYDVDRVLLTGVDFGVAKLSPEGARTSADQIIERVRALPGVEAAAFSQIVPFSGAFVARPAVPEGQTMTADNESQFMVPYAVVTEGFFGTLGMPLRGRDFSPADTQEAPRVVVVNETLAKKYWPGGNAVGQRLTLPLRDSGPPYEVIGVVRDGKYVSLTEQQHPYMYVAWKQMHRPRLTLHVRTAGQPMALAPDIRGIVSAVNRDIPAFNPVLLATYVDRSIAQQRIVARLLVLFGLVALAVATIGVYGLTAFTVTRRARELGVRLALGASPRDLVGMLVAQSAFLVGAGLVVGTVAALLLSQFVKSMLFGVTSSDPVSFAAGATLLAAATLVATILPARRATRVDPLSVLRTD